MITQLTLWDTREKKEYQVKYVVVREVDFLYEWKLAVKEYDLKRWKEGWRPWHKEGKQNDSSSR
ncbi:MAG: hypothetical protein ABWY25_09495 [Paenisporosarcina sp.]